MNPRPLCLHDDMTLVPLHKLAELIEQGQLTTKQAEQLFRRVNDRYQSRNVLTDEELKALGELRMQLTDIINPYPVEQLDKRITELNAKFPDWDHFYHRIGTVVTWYGRPKSSYHPLWHMYPHPNEDQTERDGDQAKQNGSRSRRP